MATTYHDFEEQATAALKLARLRLHISEVRAMAASAALTAGGGKGRDPSNLNTYLDGLEKRRIELEEETGEGGRGPGLTLADLSSAGRA